MTLPGGLARLFWAAAALSLGVVAAALYTQHALDMLPCPWCVLQRLIFVIVALAALCGAAFNNRTGRLLAASLMLLGAAAGMAAALWQHGVAASTTGCKLTLADRIISATGLDAWLPGVFGVWATCADAAVDLLGLPYEAWSLLAFALLGAIAVRLFFLLLRG